MTDQIDNILKGLLQRKISLTIRNKVLKQGVLWRFETGGNYITFLFITPDGREELAIPAPFAVDTKQGIIFDYRFVTLADGDAETLALLRAQTQVKDSKFYDNILTIDIHGN